MLAWVVLFNYVAAIDIPTQAVSVTKYVETCPDEGYFFKRDMLSTVSEVCYLCFCKEDNTEAVCWLRDNKKCDAEMHVQKWGNERPRRSPLNLGNLFFGDAARDAAVGRQQQCKPHEDSFSEGCPPDDWCIGCTICDCDGGGQWNCRLLSFCKESLLDEKKRKRAKQATDPGQPGYNPFKNRKNQTSERRKNQQAVQEVAEKMAQDRQKKRMGKTNGRRFLFRNGTLTNGTKLDMRMKKKSPIFFKLTPDEIDHWTQYNLKIRKIPDREAEINRHLNNRQKAPIQNLKVRNMPNQKQKKKLRRRNNQNVAILAQRHQKKTKKKRHVVFPPEMKIPIDLIDQLPLSLIPIRDHSGEHYIENVSIIYTQPNQMAVKKPVRQMLQEKIIYKRTLPLQEKPNKLTEAKVKLNTTKQITKLKKEFRKQGYPRKFPVSMHRQLYYKI